MEENLYTLHDGDKAGAEITIGCLGVHRLNADGGHDLVREEVGKAFTQVCVTSLQMV